MIVISEVGVILLASYCVCVDTDTVLLVSGYKSAPNVHLVVVNYECGLVVLHFSFLAVVFSFNVALGIRFGNLGVSLLLHLLEKQQDTIFQELTDDRKEPFRLCCCLEHQFALDSLPEVSLPLLYASLWQLVLGHPGAGLLCKTNL